MIIQANSSQRVHVTFYARSMDVGVGCVIRGVRVLEARGAAWSDCGWGAVAPMQYQSSTGKTSCVKEDGPCESNEGITL